MAIMAGKNSPEREIELQDQIKELKTRQQELKKAIRQGNDRAKLLKLEDEAIDTRWRITELYFRTNSGRRELAASANRTESEAVRSKNFFIGPGPQPTDYFIGGDHDR